MTPPRVGNDMDDWIDLVTAEGNPTAKKVRNRVVVSMDPLIARDLAELICERYPILACDISDVADALDPPFGEP